MSKILKKLNEDQHKPAPEKSQVQSPIEESVNPPIDKTSAPLNLTEPALDQVASTMSAPNPDIETLSNKEKDEHIERVKGSYPGSSNENERVFNPEIHESDAQGKPILTPTGRYKFKKGYRAKLIVPETDRAENKREEMILAQRRMSAEMIVNTFIQTGIMVFGDEWQPEIMELRNEKQEIVQKISDKDILVESTFMYLTAKNVNDIPPGLCLAMAVTTYCLKRVSKPKTSERLKIIFGGLRGKISALFGRVTGIFRKKK